MRPGGWRHTAGEVVASVETESGPVTIERDGAALSIRSGRTRLRLDEGDALNLALAIVSPPEEWRRAMLWCLHDRHIQDMWDGQAVSAEQALVLQRLMSAMDNFGMLGGGDDLSAVKRFLEALASSGAVPGLSPLPDYEDADEE